MYIYVSLLNCQHLPIGTVGQCNNEKSLLRILALMTRTVTCDCYWLLGVSIWHTDDLSVSVLHITDFNTCNNMQESIYAATAHSYVISRTLDTVTLYEACLWPEDRSFQPWGCRCRQQELYALLNWTIISAGLRDCTGEWVRRVLCEMDYRRGCKTETCGCANIRPLCHRSTTSIQQTHTRTPAARHSHWYALYSHKPGKSNCFLSRVLISFIIRQGVILIWPSPAFRSLCHNLCPSRKASYPIRVCWR